METAKDLRREVESLLSSIEALTDKPRDTWEGILGVKLGHIVNLSIRCSPRGVQGTVRKNIVEEATRSVYNVHMTKEVDERTGRDYNKIHITAKD